MTAWLLACMSVSLSSLAQILLKKAANMSVARQSLGLAWFNSFAVLGYGMLLVAVFTSAYVLRFLGMGALTSLTALSYPLIVVLSLIVFNETVSRRQWLGMGCICAGVLVFNIA